MQPERWKKIDELYHAALTQPPEKRAESLEQACPDARPLQTGSRPEALFFSLAGFGMDNRQSSTWTKSRY